MRKKANHIRWLLCMLFVLAAKQTVDAHNPPPEPSGPTKIIYVDTEAVGANDGSSWIDAFNYLRDALTTASPGDKIRVAEGTYKPNEGLIELYSGPGRGPRTPGEEGRSATFELKSGLTVKGGFAGFGATEPNTWDPGVYETILSGDLDGNDADVNDPHDYFYEPTRADNSVNVITSIADDASTVLDGFVVTGAVNGGMVIIDGSPTILNCLFRRNSAGEGGAISIWRGQSLLKNCKFISNMADTGGALYGMDVDLTLSECSFIGNWANDAAGGALISDNAVLTGCVFRNNISQNGSGITHGGGELELIDCAFIGNSAIPSSNNRHAYGGAVWTSEATVRNCTFNSNWANDGGAIFGSVQSIGNCIFTGNTAKRGGCLYEIGDPTIKSCVFAGNRAEEGGVLYTTWYGPRLISCTLSDNSARNGNAIAWGQHSHNPTFFSMTISNCILWDGGDEIGKWEDELPDISIVYSDIQGGWPGEGNIDVDSFFAEPGYWDPNGTADDPNDDFWIEGDYHLKSQAGRWNPVSESWVTDDVTSPCIDAGDPSSPVAFEPFPNSGRINMGAYGSTTEASKSPSGIHAKYGGGTGEPNDSYLIYTAEQMNAIGANMDDWDRHFKLMADIDLSGYNGTDFNIIGNGLLPAFTGVFDGNGHTISNFTYSSTGETCIGIFGYVLDPNARIINVGMIDPNVNGGTAVGVGSLAGWIDLGTVTNCYVSGGSVMGRQQVGGLIGSSAGVITDCYAVGWRVIAEGSAGGLVGGNGGSIIDCYATGNVTGSYRVGGLVGSNSGSIIDSYSRAGVEGQNATGGLVGYINKGIVSKCFSTASVNGENNTGGLVGENRGSVINCYSSCTIDARNQVGGLVGINDGIITASYSSAYINGRNEVGGLVGYNTDDAEIVNCYADGDVLGQRYVGGLAGNNATGFARIPVIRSGTISNCYSVTLVLGDQDVGGLVGRNGDDEVSACFWDIEASGQATSAGGVGKTTLKMQDPNTYIDAGWDFTGAPGGPGDIWAETEGGGYPVLMWQLSPPPELPAFSGGTGEPDDPYLVSTADELNSIGHNPRLMTAHFKLVNDIDLTGVDFHIMASQYYPFRGTFEGSDHTISNFSYTSPEATGVGLFGYVSNGRIKNLGLIAPNVHVDKGDFHGCLVGSLAAGIITDCYVESGSVTGEDELGGLVGENGSGGIIMNCYFTGEATGKENIGGLVGHNTGTISTSYSYADVEGQTAVGGLAGRCSPGKIANCYAQGNVAGQWYVGGLVGSNGSRTGRDVGTIHNCYSASAILKGPQKGGLLGVDWGGAWSGAVNNCFWNVETSGLTTSYGGEGKTTAEMQSAGMFLNAGWDFVDEMENGTEDIWWILEGQDYPRLWWEPTQNGE